MMIITIILMIKKVFYLCKCHYKVDKLFESGSNFYYFILKSVCSNWELVILSFDFFLQQLFASLVISPTMFQIKRL
jgi:voltage-gated potassium channel Kch